MAIASSHEALEHVANAKIALGIAQGLSPLSRSRMEGDAVLPKMLAVEGEAFQGEGEAFRETLRRFAPGADFLAGRLGESDRERVCLAMSEVIRGKLKRQEEQQLLRAVEAEQVQRALEEQRKLEEEAKEVKKREADERQRKAREERQRKEVEKKRARAHTHTHTHTHTR
jgi:predicted ribosome quality control (RQC) complex YloA/Tae2 family protein